jgi:hypothetical protein
MKVLLPSSCRLLAPDRGRPLHCVSKASILHAQTSCGETHSLVARAAFVQRLSPRGIPAASC